MSATTPEAASRIGLDAPWVPRTLIFAKDTAKRGSAISSRRRGRRTPQSVRGAEDNNHAEDIVTIVREEFGKGNDFCKKVTYKSGARPEEIIKAFRTAPEFRIAVIDFVDADGASGEKESRDSRRGIVDRIATGTDIKPLEKRRRLVGALDGVSEANEARRVSRRAEPANQCLLFLRDVRSQLYFEQMKGRGTRTIDPTDLATVTPDAGSKSRFVLVDAVGVTESDKTDSRPLERKPTVPFDKLLQQVALGVRDEDTLTSLANRLARLDRSLSDGDKAELQAVGGIWLQQLATNLLQATDPDLIKDNACPPSAPDNYEPSNQELRTAAAELANAAAQPIAANPSYRDLLERKRRDREVTIDHLSGDEVLATGYDEEKARGLIENWKQFLEANRDEITALQILYNLPRRSATKAGRQFVYEELKTLAEAVARPPYHLAPAEVWKAYEHLEKRKPTADPAKVLTNLITLVRHTVDPDKEPLAPFPELVEARYQQWLEQQQRVAEASRLSSSEDQRRDASGTFASPRFTREQVKWLDIIKNTIALNGAFPTDEQDDYLEAWQNFDSKEGVPLAVARKAFGGDPKPIIEELNEVLVA